MKKSIPTLAALCSLVLLLNLNAAAKNSSEFKDPATETTPKTPLRCFVQLNDGSIQEYSSLKLVTGILITPHLLADDKVVINSKDIMAYQNNEHYAVTAKILTSNKNSKVAVETLPGFAIKIISGKLNVYSRKYYNGANTVQEYFLQNGSDGFIVAYTKEVLLNMLKEDAKALEYFSSEVKVSPKSKKLLVAIQLYNDGQLTVKN